MRNSKPGEKYRHHPYDLSISYLIIHTWAYLQESPYSTLHKGDESEAKLLMDFYNDYRRVHGIEENSLVVIEAGDPDYNTFLAIALSLYDPFKIAPFLNYHKTKFIGNNFENVIEFEVYGLLDFYVPIENKERKKIIMEWVNKSRSAIQTLTTEKVTDNQPIKLEWHGDYLQARKRLSELLKLKGFIHRQTDFEEVFTVGKRIEWLKEAKYLCYLLCKLRTNGPPLFFASKGKGVYKIVPIYFWEDSGKLSHENFISRTINRFKDKSNRKPDAVLDSIDTLVSQSLSNASKK